MNQAVQQEVLQLTAASAIRDFELIQELWSGYGGLWKVQLEQAAQSHVIVKHINPPGKNGTHPRGWNTGKSHQRKLQSYRVEQYWYQHYASKCTEDCRVAKWLGSSADQSVLILEDLDNAGFSVRKSWLAAEDVKLGLSWLASFHATFMSVEPEGLWPVGTYWHLATRPDELQAMDDPALKKVAGKIDKLLSNCCYKTLVHGDAKVANFCFSLTGISAVDFQYIGGGCGMKDVIYFLGSCLDDQQIEAGETTFLDHYFTELQKSLPNDFEFESLEKEWRSMYAVAWTDFHRFLSGWMPGHWKMHRYSKKQRLITLDLLNQ